MLTNTRFPSSLHLFNVLKATPTLFGLTLYGCTFDKSPLMIPRARETQLAIVDMKILPTPKQPDDVAILMLWWTWPQLTHNVTLGFPGLSFSEARTMVNAVQGMRFMNWESLHIQANVRSYPELGRCTSLQTPYPVRFSLRQSFAGVVSIRSYALSLDFIVGREDDELYSEHGNDEAENTENGRKSDDTGNSTYAARIKRYTGTGFCGAVRAVIVRFRPRGFGQDQDTKLEEWMETDDGQQTFDSLDEYLPELRQLQFVILEVWDATDIDLVWDRFVSLRDKIRFRDRQRSYNETLDVRSQRGPTYQDPFTMFQYRVSSVMVLAPLFDDYYSERQ